MPDKSSHERWECPECGGPATSMMWGPECNSYHKHARSAEGAPRAVKCTKRTYVAVDALLSDETIDAASWEETMEHGRIGTDGAHAVLLAAVDHLTGGQDDA